MNIRLFLIIGGSISLITGLSLLLSPDLLKKASSFLNQNIFAVDEKTYLARKPLAVIFFLLSILYWYVAFGK